MVTIQKQITHIDWWRKAINVSSTPVSTPAAHQSHESLQLLFPLRLTQQSAQGFTPLATLLCYSCSEICSVSPPSLTLFPRSLYFSVDMLSFVSSRLVWSPFPVSLSRFHCISGTSVLMLAYYHRIIFPGETHIFLSHHLFPSWTVNSTEILCISSCTEGIFRYKVT